MKFVAVRNIKIDSLQNRKNRDKVEFVQNNQSPTILLKNRAKPSRSRQELKNRVKPSKA